MFSNIINKLLDNYLIQKHIKNLNIKTYFHIWKYENLELSMKYLDTVAIISAKYNTERAITWMTPSALLL